MVYQSSSIQSKPLLLAGAIRNEAQLKEKLDNTQGGVKQLYEILANKLEQADEAATNLYNHSELTDGSI